MHVLMITASMSPAVRPASASARSAACDATAGACFANRASSTSGSNVERFAQMIEREMAAADAVVAAKHFPEDRLRSRVERRQIVGRDERVPALHLRPARRRRRGAKPAEEHSLNLAEKMRFRLRSNQWPRDRNGSSWRPKR